MRERLFYCKMTKAGSPRFAMMEVAADDSAHAVARLRDVYGDHLDIEVVVDCWRQCIRQIGGELIAIPKDN